MVNMVFLGWLGAMPAEGIYVIMGRVAMAIYFGYFVALWLLSKNEKTLPLPKSISEAVLSKPAAAH